MLLNERLVVNRALHTVTIELEACKVPSSSKMTSRPAVGQKLYTDLEGGVSSCQRLPLHCQHRLRGSCLLRQQLRAAVGSFLQLPLSDCLAMRLPQLLVPALPVLPLFHSLHSNQKYKSLY